MAAGGLRLVRHVPSPDDDPLWIYAVRNKRDTSEPVKFGITADFDRRFRALQTGHPYPLAKLAVVPGSKAMERAIHNLLAPWRTSGEWFRSDGTQLTRFAKYLTEDDFCEALLRWDAFDAMFKRSSRSIIGMEDDEKWLEFVCGHICSGICRLIHFIDSCGEVARNTDGSGVLS